MEHKAPTYTRKLARYTLAMTDKSVSPKDVLLGKLFFLDALGCIIAGSGDDALDRLKTLTASYGGKPTSRTLGQRSIATNPCTAAMIDGVAAHIRDFDDYSLAVNGHIGAVLVPTIMALGEREKSTGRELLLAFLSGTMVSGALGRGLADGGYSPFWDPTGTVAVFGAASAAGRLLRLTEDQLTCAYSIASSVSSGVKANNGSIVKDLTAGRTAANGIYAVEVARLDLGCNEGVMEDVKGFAKLAAPGFDPSGLDRLLESDGDIFGACGMTMKLHPTCRGTHNGIDAALRLRREAAPDPARITEILCEADRAALSNEKPAVTPRLGKVNMAYCLSLALLNGEIVMEDFRRKEIPPEVRQLSAKVRIVPTEFPGDPPYTTRITVTSDDGRRDSRIVHHPKGDVCDMLSPEECQQKFRLCAQRVLGAERCSRVVEAVMDLENLKNCGELTDLLT